jgi:hypothetical protein
MYGLGSSARVGYRDTIHTLKVCVLNYHLILIRINDYTRWAHCIMTYVNSRILRSVVKVSRDKHGFPSTVKIVLENSARFPSVCLISSLTCFFRLMRKKVTEIVIPLRAKKYIYI